MRPVIFEYGNFQLHSFGVALVAAFIAAIWLIRRRAARYQFDPNKVTDICFYALIAGILGARIVFIVQELPYYLSHTSELLSLKFQGLTSFGGLLFGLGAFLYGAKRLGRSPIDLLDLIAPAFMLGHAIGRIGCFLNGCCYGGYCPVGTPLAFPVDGHLHYPAQLYDSLMNIAGMLLLLRLEKRGLAKGQVLSLFLVLHGLSRFIYEFWRAGTISEVASGQASSTYWAGLPITQAQAVAGAMVLVGFALFLLWNRRGVVQQEVSAA